MLIERGYDPADDGSSRFVLTGPFYVLRSGCPWRMVPDCFAPAPTVYRWFVRLREEGVFATLNHHLLLRERERLGRPASPSAAVHRQPERQEHRSWRPTRL